MPGLMVLMWQYIKHLFTGQIHSTVAALLFWWGDVVGKVIQDAFDTKDWAETRVVREKDHDPKVRTSDLTRNTKFLDNALDPAPTNSTTRRPFP